jgi:hypothetical protein
MGLSNEQHAELLAGLTPATQKPAEKEHGHARGQTDDRRLKDKALRGIPCVGAGPGAIDGTKPGDSAAALEQAGRDILAAHLNRNRYRPGDKT